MKVLALVSVLAAINVGISATDIRCNLRLGKGVGRDSQWMGNLARQLCIDTCIKRKNTVDNSINGVTVYDSEARIPGCFCEMDMRSQSHNIDFASCFFETDPCASNNGGCEQVCTNVNGAAQCSNYRCNGEDEGCCTKEKPCVLGDGDCDYNNQCEAGLICGKNNCPWGDDDDCCLRLDKRCNGDDEGCCTKDNPCKLGDGDCDHDNQCEGSLVCGTNNCPWGDDDDCCRRRSFKDFLEDVKAAEYPTF